MEHHNIDLPYWENYVHTIDKKPLIEKGFANVPDSPGLGVKLNEEEIKKHLDPKDKTIFAPTPEWNEKRSWDRLRS